jgi:MFS family permease
MSITAPDESKASLHDTHEAVGPHEHEHQDAHAAKLTISRPLKVAIGTSFSLRLAGASAYLMLGIYLKQMLNADAWLISMLAVVFYATELLLAPLFGALSDLRGRKTFLVLGPLAGAIAVQIYPLTIIPIVIAIGRMFEGVATASNTPGTLGYLADSTSGHSKKHSTFRGRVMGLYEISFTVGIVAGQVFGSQLWERIGSDGFRVLSLVYLASAAALFFLVPESLPHAAREHHLRHREASREAQHPVRTLLKTRLSSYALLLGEPTLRSFVPAWLAVNAVLGLWQAHIAALMVKHHDESVNPFPDQLLAGHLTPAQVGYTQAAFGVAFLLGIFIWSQFYGRIRRTTMMLAAVVGLFTVIITLFCINNQVLPGPWGQWPFVPLAVIGVLLMSGFTPVALAYLADISETRLEHRGAVMGLYSVFLGVGQLAGAFLGGIFIVGYAFNGLLVASLLLALIATGAILYLRIAHKV